MIPRFIPRSEISAADWDGLAKASPDGWVFSLYGWQELILAVAEWQLAEQSFGIVDGDELVAVVPLQFSAANRRMGSSGWGGSGPVVRGSIEGDRRSAIFTAGLDECLARAAGCGAAGFDVQLAPVTGSSLGAPERGIAFFGDMEDRSGLSQIIDLSADEDTLWSGVAKTARWTIRKARKAGYQVRRVVWRDYVDAYYQAHVETYTRTGVQPHPRAYFQGMADHTAPDGYSVLWAAFSPEGTPIAFHNDAYFRGGAMYHTGCSTQQALDDGVNYLLFWEAVIGARGEGIRWFDAGAVFPGATDPKQIGLTTFKTRFGGEPKRLFRAAKALEPVLPEPMLVAATEPAAIATRSHGLDVSPPSAGALRKAAQLTGRLLRKMVG